MPMLKKGTIIPTEEENILINQAIANDEDTYELSKDDFKQLRHAGRPKLDKTKKHTNLRLDEDILQAFKASGKGWQTRINNALAEWLKTHKLP